MAWILSMSAHVHSSLTATRRTLNRYLTHRNVEQRIYELTITYPINLVCYDVFIWVYVRVSFNDTIT